MSIWTTTELDQQIAAYKTALLKLSTAQSHELDGRRVTRADLPEIRATLDYLAAEKAKLTGQGLPVIMSGRPRR